MTQQSRRIQRSYARRATAQDEKDLDHRRQPQRDHDQVVMQNVAFAPPRTTLQRPQTLSSRDVLHLQGVIGNSAVARMVDPNPIRQYSGQTIQRDLVSRETKIAAINAHIGILEAAKLVLRVGHGVVMLPFTIIDLLSNFWRFKSENSIFRPPTDGKKNRLKSAKFAFDNVLNGETRLVSKMAGEPLQVKGINLDKALKWGPWNLGPWIMRLLNKWITRLERKKAKLA